MEIEYRYRTLGYYYPYFADRAAANLPHRSLLGQVVQQFSYRVIVWK